MSQCKNHPDAPHGFLRNASHTEDRYVCECEFWEPPMNEHIPVSQDHALMDRTLQEFVIMFSLNEREMASKFVDHYPKAAQDLRKAIEKMQTMSRILRV